jgi:hypothetical protein
MMKAHQHLALGLVDLGQHHLVLLPYPDQRHVPFQGQGQLLQQALWAYPPAKKCLYIIRIMRTTLKSELIGTN